MTWIAAWTPLPPDAWLRKPGRSMPFPLGEPNCEIYSLGRQATLHGARALGLGPGDEVLAPAYHAGPDIEALHILGVRCRWYEATTTLDPDAAELESLLGERTRALYLVHPLGFPLDARRWRRWCDERDLLLIEDAAQSWLATLGGEPVGSFGDMSLTCLYKMLPIPDGAAVISSPPPPTPRSRSRLGLGGIVHGHGAWAGQRLGAIGAARARLRPVPPFDAAEHMRLGDPDLGATRLSRRLLPRLADASIRDRRRENYTRLLASLAEFVPAPFQELTDGACPWMFPVVTAAKARVLVELRGLGISAMDFWSAPHPLLTEDAFPRALERRRSTVALPVHQELRARDLERIASVASSALGRG